MKRTKQELHDLFLRMVNILRIPDCTFTKSKVMSYYNLTFSETKMFIKYLDENKILGYIDKAPNPKWNEIEYFIVLPKIQPLNLPYSKAIKYKPKHIPRKMMGFHTCNRCGAVIPGTGRHAKSARGHTQDVCDAMMVQVIMDNRMFFWSGGPAWSGRHTVSSNPIRI